ncbi:MAG: hypothetical protein NVSMB31_05320 [Vulcanimicrobiaceae bacterium]
MTQTFEAVLFDLFGTLVDDRGTAIDGAVALLRTLPQDRWAIVTSCGRKLAFDLVAYAGLPAPKVLVSSDDVADTKPHPACYLQAAKHLGKTAVQCLVVEDSNSGIAAGKAAGMTVLAVARAPAAEDSRADYILPAIRCLKLEIQENGTIALR